MFESLQRWMMRWMLGQRPIDSVVPRLDELLRSPVEELRSRPLTLRPARRWLALLLLTPAMALLGGILVGHEHGAVGGGALGLALVVVGLFAPRHWVHLDVNAVVFRSGQSALRCPWALFVASGRPVMELGSNVRLPVNPAAAQRVTLEVSGARRGSGPPLKNGIARLLSPLELLLMPRVAVTTEDLLWLLGQLAPALGGDHDAQAASPLGAYRRSAQPEPLEAAAQLSSTGWLTALISRLRFPASCCGCGQPTDAWSVFNGSVRMGWLVRLGGSDWSVGVPIPFCEGCYRSHRRRTWGLVALGLLAGPALGVALASLLPVDEVGRVMIVVVGLLFGPMTGWLVGSTTGLPVKLARYRPLKGTVDLRFQRPGYAEEVLELTRSSAPQRGAQVGSIGSSQWGSGGQRL